MVKVAVVGNGNLGKSIARYLKLDIITKENIEDCEKYNILINCTPGYALPFLPGFFKNKTIINCCKGIYYDKTASDYFENCYSIGGFYLHNLLFNHWSVVMPKNTPRKVRELLKPLFEIEYIGTSKEIEMIGVLKNISLISNLVIPYSEFKFTFNISEKLINYYFRDFELSKEFLSRNRLCYLLKRNGLPTYEILDKLGLVEGVYSLYHIDKSYLRRGLKKVKKIYER